MLPGLKSEAGGSTADAFAVCSHWKFMVETQPAPRALLIPQSLPRYSYTLWCAMPSPLSPPGPQRTPSSEGRGWKSVGPGVGDQGNGPRKVMAKLC